MAWVSPTRGLTWEASAINGLPCYLDLPEKGTIEGSVSVCIPSLPRCLSLAITPAFEIQEAGVDLLVLDEVEQSLRSLGGDHLSDWQAKAAYHSVIGHIHAAKNVVAMDADAGVLTQEIFRLAGKELTVVEGPAPAPRDALVFASRAEWLARVIELATKGKRLVLPVHSVEEAEVLARTVPAYQGMPTAVLSRETVSKFDMSNINSELLRHGHLIYTPLIGTGVSITLKDHFDHVCPLLSNSIGTASDAMQFVNRVRHPRHRGLLIGSLGGGRSPAPWESDPEQVLRVLFAREEATLQRIGFIRQLPAELAVLHDGHRVLNPDSLAYCKFLALVHAEKVLDGEGRVIKAFLERLEANGGKIYEYRTEKPTVGAKAASKARKAEKEVVVEERVQEIVAAPIPEASKVEEIKRRGPKSKNEANILRKAGIEAFYGEGTGSDE
ncbi:MAG TPA: hypothetical protein PLA94_27085, partial [Myxococcota bacterium]|nr:hypothetical protein [Myxococcota bacterium]